MSTSAAARQGSGYAHEEAHATPHGWRRWLYATNHKDIGTLYLWFSLIMFMTGGLFALLIRAELFQPGLQFFQPELYNQFATMHGLLMVFGAIMPAFVGFANWMVPLQAPCDRLRARGPGRRLPARSAHRRRRAAQVCLDSCWTRIALPDRDHALIVLEARGIRVQVGAFVSDGVRAQVGQELRSALRSRSFLQ